MTEAEALAQLAKDTAAARPPLLSDDDLRELLTLARRPDSLGYLPDALSGWEATTAYALGAQRVPAARNGHYYEVTTGGTSGATEPPWPTTTGAIVTDGAAIWQERGRAYWTPTWDLNWAAAEGWRRKAGQIADAYNVGDTGQSLSRGDLLDHFQRMERSYRRRVQGTLNAGAGPAYYPSQVPNP